MPVEVSFVGRAQRRDDTRAFVTCWCGGKLAIIISSRLKHAAMMLMQIGTVTRQMLQHRVDEATLKQSFSTVTHMSQSSSSFIDSKLFS